MSEFKVTSIRAGYERKRRPADFESAGATLEFSAQRDVTLGDGEDHVEAAKKLLAEAKTIVLTEIGIIKPGTTASASPAPQPAPAPKAEIPAAPKEPKEPKAPKAPKPAAAANAEIPDSAPAAPKAETPAAPKNDDIPGDDGKAAPAGPKPGNITPVELQGFITENIKAKNLTPVFVRDLMDSDKYGKVSRLGEMDQPKLNAFKAELDAKIAETKKT